MIAAIDALKKDGTVSAGVHAELVGASPPAADGAAPMEGVAASDATVSSLVSAFKAVHTRGDISTVVYTKLMALKPPLPDGEEEPQPESEVLDNPARVLRTQERHMALLANSRYTPVAAGRRAGIIVLKDSTPDEAEDLLQVTASVAGPGANADEEEPSPPAPFEFTE